MVLRGKMKAFREWFEKHRHWNMNRIDAERGYRAALKWILSWETDQESREIIEKELNGNS